MKYIEEKLSVPIKKECEVLVAGGGFAGISAALAAARHGKKVLLIENEFALGGLGTLGIVTIYLPLCDGEGHQVIYGIGEELFHLSMKDGYEDRYPTPWLEGGTIEEKIKTRFEVRYNANMFILQVEKLLLDAGVEILYGTRICSATTENDKITNVIIENKSGRTAVACDSVIDCTGDADVAHFAGAETAKFGQGNILAAWYYYMTGGKKELQLLGFADIPDEDKKENGEPAKLVSRRFSGLDGDEISEMMQLSHTQTLKHIKNNRREKPDFEPTMIATIPQIRMTRRIVGDYDIDTSDDKAYFEDSIGMTGNWKKRGPVYEISFRCIRSKNIKNLLAAGRCISATYPMWDVTRVIPVCAVTGEAAGVAASMTNDFSTIDIKALQNELRRGGVKLHTDEILS